jgi:hypothetical protein
MKRLLASLFLCLAFATAARANCYVLQNNTDQEQKWAFSYDTDVGPRQLRSLTMAPHDRYPAEGQWCWNGVPWKATVRVASGSYRRSWSGAFTMGDGEAVSPSGTYALEPVAEAPPARARRARPAAADPASPIHSPPLSAAPAAAPSVSTPSIACVDDRCAMLFQDGRVAYVESRQPSINGAVAIAGFKGPGSISCLSVQTPPGETCVVTDSAGQTWKGPLRPGAGPWTH